MKAKSSLADHLIWLVIGLCLIAVIWLPFGFALGGLIEEWDELGLFTRQGPIFYIHSQSLAFLRGRPLTFFPQAVAYALNENNFIYWHLLLALSLLIKFMASCYIGRYMTRSMTAGLLIGALALLFPADTMQINLRSLHIDWAIAIAVTAGAIVLMAEDVDTSWFRIVSSLVAAVLFVFANLIYEAVISLSLLPLAAIYVRYGLRLSYIRSMRRPIILIIWVATLLACLCFIAIIGQQSDSYQGALIGKSGGISAKIQYLWQTIVFVALYRGFWQAWTDIYTLAWTELSFRGVFLIITSNLTIGFYCLVILEERKNTLSWTRKTPIMRLFITGLTIFIACYSPFLLSTSHVAITQRTFLTSALGGAMVVAALILAFRAFLPGRIIAALLAAPIVAASLLAQIYQHDQYNRIYAEAGRPMIKAFATIAAAFPPGQTMPIVSRYGSLTATWDFGIPVPLMTVYLSQTSGLPIVCDGRTGRILPLARPPSKTICVIEQDGLHIATPGIPTSVYPRFAVIETDGSVTIHDRKSNIGTQTPELVMPPVLRVGNWTVADSWFNRRRRAGLAWECTFGSMWGYAVPCKSFGLYEGELSRVGHTTTSFSWVNEARAGLILGPLPPNISYLLTIDLQNFVATPALDQLTLSFNERPLAYSWSNPRRIQADIPRELIAERSNVLGIDTPLNEQLGLSIGLHQVEIWKR